MKPAKALIFLMLLCPALARAGSVTLEPSDVLQITFTTLANPDCSGGGGPCDTLIFNLGFTDNPLGAKITSARLFDGTKLLGNYQPSGDCPALVPVYIASGSAWGLCAPVTDFSTILDGTIKGVIDIQLDKPIEFDPESSWNFFAVTHAEGRGIGIGGYFKGYDSIAVIETPEPATFLMLAAALGTSVCFIRSKITF